MTSWYGLALLGLGVITLSALMIGVHSYRCLKRQERRYQALLNVLRHEIRVMSSGAIGMGRRLRGVEARLNITAEKQQELENRDPGTLAYNQAAKLMEMGAEVDDLVSSCGIARPEAELMALLHREVASIKSLDADR
jgi:hypothetical protein